jgi:chromosome segregation protein
MYLSKLELVGFKSFALKTDLAFTDGVTAIVGPNGCGKTNIVDAIRWVLGEQKTSALRADSMDQVIFNGSKDRKPLGMAEVALTIENNKQILPTEYSQVTIARRLFRNGDSQYLLNGTVCRLRDIVDLFMDTGMGADAYSVIELKMIETILSDKAEERRHLFEEAAGVVKYKQRRREAQRKLETAQRDISRVQDIVREVQKTVNSLARQAEKARQHQEISTQLRELERLLFAVEYAQEYVALKQLEAVIADVRARKDAAEQAVTTGETAERTAESAHEEHDRALRAALESESNARASLSERQQHVSVTDERISSVRRALERLEREHEESAEQLTSTDEQLRSARSRIDVVRAELEQAQSVLQEKQTAHAAVLASVQSARTDLQTHRETLAGARQGLNDQRSLADRYRVQGEGVQRRIHDAQARLVQMEERLSQVHAQIATESAALPALETTLHDAEERLHVAEQRQQTLRADIERDQTALDDARTRAAHTRASLEFLTGLVDTAESSQFLLSTAEWKPRGEKLTLAEVINTQEDLRIAIEAALGDAGKYFVVADRDEAQQAIAALSRNKVGKATFLCRDSIPSMPAPSAAPGGPGAIGWASELVQTDDELRGAVRGILGRTLIVRSVDDAWEAVRAGAADTAVTVAGEIVRAAGAVRGGSTTSTEGVRVGRRERIAQLIDELQRLDASIAELEGRITAAKTEIAGIDLRALGDAVRRAALLRNEVQQRVDTLHGRVDDIAGQRDVISTEVASFETELQDLATRSAEAESAATHLAEQLASLEHAVQQAQEHVHAAEHLLDGSSADVRAAEITAVRLSGDLNALESDASRLSDQTLSLDARREQRERERVTLNDELQTLSATLTTATSELENWTVTVTTARAERERLELTVREALAAFHAAGEDLRAARRAHDAVTNELHEADLRFNEVRLRMEAMAQRAVEELNIEVPTEPVVPEMEEQPETVRTTVQDMRRRLTSMGNVNFLALEEHEREAERLEFLTKQLSDLIDSERTLQETIAEINRTAREQFTNTFIRIRENFVRLFKVLFTEDDEADLQMLEDEDPLECRIEITAKPRGKRPHSIEMLSGGEKTLTAIALLFSIYLVKPSPFCILDEVDAPLDDANIDRYLNLIKSFSKETQFLMITHNKKTMEAADTLYGVTMEEPAVSKLVSVRLAADVRSN